MTLAADVTALYADLFRSGLAELFVIDDEEVYGVLDVHDELHMDTMGLGQQVRVTTITIPADAFTTAAVEDSLTRDATDDTYQIREIRPVGDGLEKQLVVALVP